MVERDALKEELANLDNFQMEQEVNVAKKSHDAEMENITKKMIKEQEKWDKYQLHINSTKKNISNQVET